MQQHGICQYFCLVGRVLYTYSDLIYTKTNAPLNGTLNEQGILEEEAGKPLIQTEDVSSNKEPKLPSKASSVFIQKGKTGEQPKP